MQTVGSLICPYLKGSQKGALCRIENRFVKESNGADIHVCMSDSSNSARYSDAITRKMRPFEPHEEKIHLKGNLD